MGVMKKLVRRWKMKKKLGIARRRAPFRMGRANCDRVRMGMRMMESLMQTYRRIQEDSNEKRIRGDAQEIEKR